MINLVNRRNVKCWVFGRALGKRYVLFIYWPTIQRQKKTMIATDVLRAIQSIHDKQTVHKPIGVDTLLLTLKVNPAVLLPLIDELQLNLDIVYHPSKSPQSKRGSMKYGTVTLSSK